MNWDALKKTVHYWMETETHVYAFSVAANVLLSFFPFLVVISAMARLVFPDQVVRSAMSIALSDYFPPDMTTGLLGGLLSSNRGSLELMSILLLLFTANGPSNDVSVVDVATRTVVRKIKAGDRPWGVVTVPR